MANPSEDEIKARAYQLWEQAGKPEGREEEFWLQAEQALREQALGERDQLREIATEPPPTILPG